MKCSSLLSCATAWLLSGRLVASIELNLSSPGSIRSVAGTLAYDMMSIYKGNESGQTPGQFPFPPYYWWEAGAIWGGMIDYWYYTNDSTYNDVVEEAILFQVGPNWDFLPPNQTLGMGNDDQGFWGMTAMTAAELNFQNPPESGPQWLGLAQAVFNQFVSRVEPGVCGGGLRWQVYFISSEWAYKNAISNGCLFNLGARLAKYTGNDTYAYWAEYTWNWITSINLMEYQPYGNGSRKFITGGTGPGGLIVWDGADTNLNCSVINGIPYSYNAGIWLLGAATMYNYTNGSEIWANRTELLLNATINVFFPNKIATEVYCEYNLTSCNTDMLSFKAYLTRWMAATTQLAPFTKDKIMTVLAASAAAAAKQCSGGVNGRMCGLSWGNGSRWDGTQGAGQQMAAIEVMLANLIHTVHPPLTNTTGGTSIGDPTAGGDKAPYVDRTISTAWDRFGAALLTIAILMAMMWGFIWISTDWNEVGAAEKPLREYLMAFMIQNFMLSPIYRG